LRMAAHRCWSLSQVCLRLPHMAPLSVFRRWVTQLLG
jgi:hypothetical protein